MSRRGSKWNKVQFFAGLLAAAHPTHAHLSSGPKDCQPNQSLPNFSANEQFVYIVAKVFCYSQQKLPIPLLQKRCALLDLRLFLFFFLNPLIMK